MPLSLQFIIELRATVILHFWLIFLTNIFDLFLSSCIIMINHGIFVTNLQNVLAISQKKYIGERRQCENRAQKQIGNKENK